MPFKKLIRGNNKLKSPSGLYYGKISIKNNRINSYPLCFFRNQV